MFQYYQITAKCGHVGRNFYIPIDFFVKASSATEAAAIARKAPRVKHHHKDAILSVQQITHEEFLQGNRSYNADPYTTCHSRQQQSQYLDILADRIIPEAKIPSWQNREKTRCRNLKRSLRYGYDSDNRLITKHPIPAWEPGCAA